MDGKKAKALDVFPFWERVNTYLDFVGGRLKFGQTDAGALSIDDYLELSYKKLRGTIISSDADARVTARLLFWDDCKKAFAPVFDCQAKKTIGSPSFADFYSTLYKLQRLALASPEENWRSGKRPAFEPFPAEAPRRERSRSLRRTKGKGGKGKGKAAQDNTPDIRMGKQGVWSWEDPPTVLVEQDGFLLLSKAAYWLCNTPDDPKEFDNFKPRPDDNYSRLKGSVTIWLRERYGQKHEFMMKYQQAKGQRVEVFQYGLLNRLDRETSGIVVVGKNMDLYKKLKKKRDNHDWFKEYVCLVHGKIPVGEWQGIIENPIKEKDNNKLSKGETIDFNPENKYGGLPQGFRPATSHYQVLEYYGTPGMTNRFTLVKVRILTGLQHQIRLHMRDRVKELGDAVLDGLGVGLVGDFMYLDKAVADEDKRTRCERVFLHEQTLGFWDPASTARWVCAHTELPKDLQSCLDWLGKDTLSNEEFEEYLQAKRESDPVFAFCQKYKLGPRENQLLREGCWTDGADGEKRRRWFLEEFEKQAGSGLESLSAKGDHTFLFEAMRTSLEAQLPYIQGDWNAWHAIKQEVDSGIQSRLWEQNWANEQKQAREAQANLPVAEGWRRMELNGGFFYLHSSGRRQQRRPVPDPDLLHGWLKLESESNPGMFFYFHEKTRKTLNRPPRVEDDIPAGWVRQESRNEPGTFYYIHIQTGTVQLGMPCEGPPEDLPEGWEKVRSSKGGDPFYFHRTLSVSLYQRPTANTAQALEYGWTVHRSKSTGKEYFYNPHTGENQLERPSHPAKPPTNSSGQ